MLKIFITVENLNNKLIFTQTLLLVYYINVFKTVLKSPQG